MTHKKVPTYLTDEQRQIMMEIPTDLDDRDLARYYTLTPEELELVNLRRRPGVKRQVSGNWKRWNVLRAPVDSVWCRAVGSWNAHSVGFLATGE